MRILVFRGGALGDFLVTLPALRALQARYPGASIELVGNRRAAELGLLAGLLSAVYDQHESRWSALFSEDDLPAALREWLSRFDLIVAYWPDSDGTIARHLASLPARLVSGTATVATTPAARHFLAPLAAIGAEGDAGVVPLASPAAIRVTVRQRLARLGAYMAIHAGSGSSRKNWPLPCWHELTRRLGRPVLWITGEADDARPPSLATPLVQADRWPLVELLAALADAEVYLGHDTGVTHLAGAAGAVGLVLFGPTDPAMWSPPSERMHVVQAPDGDLRRLAVEQVEDVFKKRLSGDRSQSDVTR